MTSAITIKSVTFNAFMFYLYSVYMDNLQNTNEAYILVVEEYCWYIIEYKHLTAVGQIGEFLPGLSQYQVAFQYSYRSFDRPILSD